MSSEKKALTLLDKQIDKLDIDPFDLEAWKSGAVALVELLFGPGHSAIGQIKALKVDYSSWALRDATARYNPLITCKLMGKEVLENAKAEIELYGLSRKTSDDTTVNASGILTPAEYKKLAKALEATPAEKKAMAVSKVVAKWKPERTVEVLAQLLASQPGIIA